MVILCSMSGHKHQGLFPGLGAISLATGFFHVFLVGPVFEGLEASIPGFPLVGLI